MMVVVAVLVAISGVVLFVRSDDSILVSVDPVEGLVGRVETLLAHTHAGRHLVEVGSCHVSISVNVHLDLLILCSELMKERF